MQGLERKKEEDKTLAKAVQRSLRLYRSPAFFAAAVAAHAHVGLWCCGIIRGYLFPLFDVSFCNVAEILYKSVWLTAVVYVFCGRKLQNPFSVGKGNVSFFPFWNKQGLFFRKLP